MQNKFFGSKLNTVLLLILIILMVFAIRIMRQNKEVYFGAWQSKEVTNNNLDELNYLPNQNVPITDKTPLAGLRIFGISEKNPSGLSSDQYVIFASEIKYKTDNPICGHGGNELTTPCSIFVKKSSGEVVKVGEWPSSSANDDTFNFFENNSLTFLDKNTLWFKSNFSLQCSGQATQDWHFDLQNYQSVFLSQDKNLVNDCD